MENKQNVKEKSIGINEIYVQRRPLEYKNETLI